MDDIFVTKSFLPPREEFDSYIDRIYSSAVLTNQGPLVMQLQEALKSYLGLKNQYLHYLANGTLALQLALAALDINAGEVITTPFSYVATTSAILWQRCKPVFVDIEDKTFTIDASKIESAITPKTRAIMGVHVFGLPCNEVQIKKIALKHNLKVIYDGAHAFGSSFNGRSILEAGDISTLSFHATKLFHTVEGGACIVHDKAVSEKIELQKRFGHVGDDHFMLGINAKTSEFHAAMGLSNLAHIKNIIAQRKKISEQYDSMLDVGGGIVTRPVKPDHLEYNYAYYPVLFKNEDELLRVFKTLAAAHIYPRRYFYPSLNNLPYVENVECPISVDISSRIACLPLYIGLQSSEVKRICRIINYP